MTNSYVFIVFYWSSMVFSWIFEGSVYLLYCRNVAIWCFGRIKCINLFSGSFFIHKIKYILLGNQRWLQLTDHNILRISWLLFFIFFECHHKHCKWTHLQPTFQEHSLYKFPLGTLAHCHWYHGFWSQTQTLVLPASKFFC